MVGSGTMDLSSDAEFAPYRFVRDASGELVALPAPEGAGGTVHLVLDVGRWGLARLHRFAGAASAEGSVEGSVEVFEKEMRSLSGLGSDRVARLFSWGRKGEDLFYADAMGDGEPLPAYLGRVGKVPAAVASRWILGCLDGFAGAGELPRSVRALSASSFEVVRRRGGGVDLVFSGFHGWSLPEASLGDCRLERSLARVLCELVGGEETLPPTVRRAVDAILSGGGDGGHGAFHEALLLGSGEGGEEVPLPQMPWREWLRLELERVASSEHRLSEWPVSGEEVYAIATTVRGAATHLQLLPGPGSLPREGWLEQHHDATRRPGRGKAQQLHIHWIEDLDSITLVGEERVEGVDLAALVAHLGPLDEAVAGILGERIDSALAGLESRAGAGSIWWLPPENVMFLTGSRSPAESVGRIGREGAAIWSEWPLKLRLHQTIASLMEGVGLPATLREGGLVSGTASEALRRSVVGLPLLWHVLTGTRFCWHRSVPGKALSPDLSARFEACRVALLDGPGAVEVNFLRDFARWPLEEAGGEEVVEEESGLEVSAEALPADPEPAEALDHEEVEVSEEIGNGIPSIDPMESLEEAPPEDAPSAPVEWTGEPSVQGKAAPPWLWIAVSAALIAAAVGYALSGWSRELGPFRPAGGAVFALPELRADGAGNGCGAKDALGSFLTAEGSVRSLRLLAVVERLDHEADRSEIEAWLRRLSSEGDPAAARVMGMMALAFGSAGDLSAEEWFLEAARRGDPESCYRYALSGWDATGRVLSDAEARRLLDQAAASGHSAARVLLAHVLAGEGDVKGAFQSMEHAAAQGWRPAIHQLGVFHAKGLGCAPDPALAAEQFRRAAELGDEHAMHDYGLCLAEGLGTPASFSEATRWMRLAAARGHRSARRWLLDRGLDPKAVS